jgi:hypothetical protein
VSKETIHRAVSPCGGGLDTVIHVSISKPPTVYSTVPGNLYGASLDTNRSVREPLYRYKGICNGTCLGIRDTITIIVGNGASLVFREFVIEPALILGNL